jgi:hypothetical protein
MGCTRACIDGPNKKRRVYDQCAIIRLSRHFRPSSPSSLACDLPPARIFHQVRTPVRACVVLQQSNLASSNVVSLVSQTDRSHTFTMFAKSVPRHTGTGTLNTDRSERGELQSNWRRAEFRGAVQPPTSLSYRSQGRGCACT